LVTQNTKLHLKSEVKGRMAARSVQSLIQGYEAFKEEKTVNKTSKKLTPRQVVEKKLEQWAVTTGHLGRSKLIYEVCGEIFKDPNLKLSADDPIFKTVLAHLAEVDGYTDLYFTADDPIFCVVFKNQLLALVQT
jgi:hypothetical protein